MYRQDQSELTAIFRDTSGHNYSVRLKFIWAALLFGALTLINIATDSDYLTITLFFYAVPLQLFFAGMSEVVALKRAKARQLEGYDDLPPAKSTTKLTLIVFGVATLVVLWSMNSPNAGYAIGPLVFLAIVSYRIYLVIFRPNTGLKLNPSRSEARAQTRRLAAKWISGSTLHIAMIAGLLLAAMFYFYYWPSYGAPREPNLFY